MIISFFSPITRFKYYVGKFFKHTPEKRKNKNKTKTITILQIENEIS